MNAINYIKENYKKIIAITILAIVTSVLTCFFLWPEPTAVNADDTDTYGLVQELVRDEVEKYISEKNEILTRDDVTELQKRIDEILKENGLILKTVYQSEELQKIIKECIEKTIVEDRDAAAKLAKEVADLLKRIDANDKAYQELVSSYNSYRTEMSGIISQLKAETSRMMEKKADSETVAKEMDDLEKKIESLSGLTDRFEKETESRIASLDKEILTYRTEFDTFVNMYNEYKASIREILETKASKDDLENLSAQADALEENLRKSEEEFELIKAGIEENQRNISENSKRLDENEKSIEDHGEAIDKNTSDIAALTGSLSGKKLWVGTQDQYNAIGTKDANTLYFIK
ncbi:MAG: hypothetical protein IK152_03780 [Lachnospiraceae bacterium]|nr:hypothetical protein [Lachnospiraceae bacterium]